MMTFGDSVSDVDIGNLLATHQRHGRLATVTAVHPPPRFGELRLDGNEVVEFSEKPIESGWIIGGYMVMEPGVLEYIDGDDTPLSPEPMERLAKDGQLTAYLHTGFWQGIDTLRDKMLLESLWEQGSPPWRIWS
jgi:glucose-1-phosphate cytidylyltransferase